MEKKQIGVFICNYNKEKYVKKCVASVLEQTKKEIDIYVIDNASTDQSVYELKRTYDSMIKVIENQENLGGTGGFNTGLRIGCEKKYRYMVLVDNDVVMDRLAIEAMYNYMEANLDVGMCGAKILEADKGNTIQEMGGKIAYNQFQIISNYGRKLDDETIPEMVSCDFVSACTMMVRTSAIEQIGIMDNRFFIYMDDIEWCRRMKDAGYRIMAISAAKVWHHKQAVNSRPDNTFARYYLWRNKIYFFAKYVEQDELEDLTEIILRNTFNIIYGDQFKKLDNEVISVRYALEDIIHDEYGKAKEGRILPLYYDKDPFQQLMKNQTDISLEFFGEEGFKEKDRCYSALEVVLKEIFKQSPSAEITIITSQQNQEQIRIRCKIVEEKTIKFDCNQKKSAGLVLRLCGHCNWINSDILPVVYVDERFNCISNKKDYQFFLSYEMEYQKFRIEYLDKLTDAFHKIRKGK